MVLLLGIHLDISSLNTKNAVYFINIDKTLSGVKMQGKNLYQTNYQKIILKNVDWIILDLQNLSWFKYLFLIKTIFLTFIFAIVKPYVHWIYRIMNQQKFQQQYCPFPIPLDDYISYFVYFYCFNNPNFYLIEYNTIHTIDCTDITNIKKS